MKNGVKTLIFDKKYCYIAVVILVCGVGASVLYPLLMDPQAEVVFLRIPFPAVTSNTNTPIEDAPEISIPDLTEPQTAALDTEQRLVAMLQKDDLQVIYEQKEDTERWHVVRMRVTGYCSCPKCCGKFSDGKTACMHHISKGDVFVAADKRYAFGTEMIIPGYNRTQPVKVLDRGRAIKGNRLDLYFDSHSQAKKWGVKYIDVLVKSHD